MEELGKITCKHGINPCLDSNSLLKTMVMWGYYELHGNKKIQMKLRHSKECIKGSNHRKRQRNS